MIIRILVVGLTLGLFATGAEAQNQEDTQTVVVTRVEPATPDAGLTLRNGLARELIGLSAGPNFAKEFERTIAEQMDKIGDGEGEEAAWIRAAMPPMMNRMIVRLMDEMVPAYAEIYTEEELRAQIEFYRSPVGRAVAAKSMALGVALQEAQVDVLTDFMTELEGKYCARFNCDGAGQTGAKSRR
ncbi:MAG: DUF2059 domain-containing protein [Brevundimonas sp.]|uniref:DUF2059 domain-containing protein n=1 Tax=Brevundimonas sp. TaxID=1871086 RepID=UPI0028D65246|nr:DUF2059 domain-containing protein [uncultured Brevundimonas sp.]